MANVRLQLNLPPPPFSHMSQFVFSSTTVPIISVRTLWMIPLLAHLAHSLRLLENYEKNFQLVFYLRVFTMTFHRRKSKCTYRAI